MKEYLSILAQPLATVIAAYIALCKYKKVRFAESVTNARKDYLKTFREYSAVFCHLTDKRINGDVNNETYSKQLKYAYKLKMMLNPIDYVDWWDGELNKLIDDLLLNPQKKNLQKITALLQSSCILEWKGITKEGISGVLREKDKEKLRDEAYDKYVMYCKKESFL